MSAVSLWLRAGHPVVARGWADHDDALFVRLARSLVAGEWLGPYDDLTLAKGMAYPLFVATAHGLALPLKLAEQIVWLSVSAVVCRWVGRRGGPWLGGALFLLLALNPVFWDPELARVVREGIYVSLSLAVVAAAAAVPVARRRVLAGAVFGSALGAFWLTREEGIWILPAVAAALLPSVTGGRERIVSAGVSLAAAGLVFASLVGAVAGLNGHHYGLAATSEFHPGNFTRAYAALSGVHRDRWERFVVFPADARSRAYAASPAARELEPYLEGAGGRRWRDAACGQLGVGPQACAEIHSGWFMWALRDAAAEAGHMRSAAEADAYWKRLADEIGLACNTGRLACDAPHRWTMAPPFRVKYLADALARLPAGAWIMATAGGGGAGTAPSQGAPLALAAFADVVGPIAPPDPRPPVRRVVGWAAAPGAAPSLRVVQGEGQSSVALALHEAPDVQAALPGSGAVRFELLASCGKGSCALELGAPGPRLASLPFDALRIGGATDTPAGRLSIEADETFPLAPLTDGRRDRQREWARAIGSLYLHAMPVLAGLGVVGLLLAVVRRRGDPALLALGGASLVAALSRAGLLAYLDATAIPAVNPLYASPASPFVLAVAAIGVYVGLGTIGFAGPSLR